MWSSVVSLLTPQVGPVKLATQGLGPRCVMVGVLTALQFAIFDTMMPLIGAEKYHFEDPNAHEADEVEKKVEFFRRESSKRVF